MLAHAGIGSRRACEEYIVQGRVTVDGKTIKELGTRVHSGQKVAVDGQTIHSERLVYFAVNKPKGYMSTNADPSGRPRVVDLLPEIPERVFSVGRLDEASVGLMILTNDGMLANRLAHPRFGVEKIYRAVVAGTPSSEVLQKLVEGVWIAEGKVRARKARIVGRQGDASVIEMVLAEGKNREVRRMLARSGHKVMSLTRVRIGPVSLSGLKPGEFRRLTAEEIQRLKDTAAGLPVATPGRPSRRPTARPANRPAGPRAGGGPRPYAARPASGGARPAGPRPQGPRPPQGAPHQANRPPAPGGSRRPPAPADRGPRPGGGPRPVRPQQPPPPPRPPAPEPPALGRKIIGMPPPERTGGPGGRGRPPRRRPPRPGGGGPPVLKRPDEDAPTSPKRAPTNPDRTTKPALAEAR